MVICNGITKKGERCKNKCTDKTCWLHCKQALQKKIKINIDEYKTGRWVSPKQAIAVSYSQVKRKYPQCNFNPM